MHVLQRSRALALLVQLYAGQSFTLRMKNLKHTQSQVDDSSNTTLIYPDSPSIGAFSINIENSEKNCVNYQIGLKKVSGQSSWSSFCIYGKVCCTSSCK